MVWYHKLFKIKKRNKGKNISIKANSLESSCWPVLLEAFAAVNCPAFSRLERDLRVAAAIRTLRGVHLPWSGRAVAAIVPAWFVVDDYYLHSFPVCSFSGPQVWRVLAYIVYQSTGRTTLIGVPGTGLSVTRPSSQGPPPAAPLEHLLWPS